MSPMRFVLASNNPNKLREFAGILSPHEVAPMPDGIVLPPEGVTSFVENALVKARALARACAAGAPPGTLFIADDSGLEVEALGWAPGVRSSRHAGPEASDADNTTKLLAQLAGRDGAERRARFVCVVAAVTPALREYVATGEWWGAIAHSPRGDGGFGYDPVFVPEGSDLTVAQWPQALKDQASHRALAGRALLRVLQQEEVLDRPQRRTDAR